MKKVFLSLAVAAFMAGTVSSSYGQTPDKESAKARQTLNDEKKDVVVATKDLQVAQKDSVAQYQQFAKESNAKFAANEKSITDLRSRIAKSNSKNQATDQKKVSEIERKNNDLKKELTNYKVEGQTKFSTFKSEFTKNLDRLAKDLKDFKIV